MSTDQEAPDNTVEPEVTEAQAHSHNELSSHEATIEELKQALEKAEAKAQENWDRALRIQAEMENLKRRAQKDVENAHKFAVENFAKELLVVMDSLVLGLQAIQGESPEVEKFRVGNELTIKQFESVFTKFNIEILDPTGQPFNPEHHQAMSMQVVENAEPNSVVAVFQKGYTLNGRLLRPAMVMVAKASEQSMPDSPSIDEQA